MIEYNVSHIPLSSPKRTRRAMTAQYLTIHSTGNPQSTAQNERDYLTNPTNRTTTGYHIVVDDKQAIECIPFNEMAYHAGDGGSGTGNSKSVGIEICESGDREKTLRHAAEVAALTLEKLHLTPEKLRQHYDWSRKNCPRILRDTNRWHEFVGMVEAAFGGVTTPTKATTPKTLTAMPLLRRGDKGEDVKVLQRALTQAGHAVDADGDFGSVTYQSVRLFQKCKGLTADGIVGKQTWDKLTG